MTVRRRWGRGDSSTLCGGFRGRRAISPCRPARDVSCPAGSAGRICYSTRPMQIHLKTLGCRLNEAELEGWADECEARGHTLSRDPAVADLVVVKPCAVTGEAAKKSRQMIRRARRNNPAAKLVVSGCYASLDRDIKQAVPAIDLLIDNKNKDQLVETALRELDIETRPEPVVALTAPGLFGRGRHRAFVKIQDGCRFAWLPSPAARSKAGPSVTLSGRSMSTAAGACSKSC